MGDVVVVDDEPAIASAICDILEDAGITTTVCPPGRNTHQCIREKMPRLVILDIQMPEVNGITILRSLRADPSTADLPVIFVTANAYMLERWVPEYRALGAELLKKPFQLDHLLSVVNAALQSTAPDDQTPNSNV